VKIKILFLVLLSTSIFAQTDRFSGVKFNSKNVERNERTSLFLNEGSPIKFTNSFSISFDISFWTNIYFGRILRIETDDKTQINIVYNQHKNRDTSFIEVTLPSFNKRLSVPFLKKELVRNRWYNFRLVFDKPENLIRFFINDSFAGEIRHPLTTDESSYSFVFGIKEQNNFHDYDLPGMSIRNILITENNLKKYFWSLDPFENYFYDSISKVKLKLVNPSWVYEDHLKWKRIADIKISDDAIPYRGIAYDSDSSRFFIDKSDELIIYNLLTGKDSTIRFKSESPAIWSNLFYNPEKQHLYSYFTGRGIVSVYDLSKNEWIRKDTSRNLAGHYFGSGKFSYPASDDLYLLGGYGWYTFKNDLFKYNFRKEDWEKVKLKKNDISPRAWFASGKGFNEGEYFIYGGIGNESGLQEDGSITYHDLYLLDLNNSTLTKQKTHQQHNFVYAFFHGDLFLDRKDSVFYFLTQHNYINSFPISLSAYDLKDGSITTMGNEFWQLNNGKWIYAQLHYNQFSNELVSVIFDSVSVEIFVINLPLLPSESDIFQEATVEVNIVWFILTALGILAVIVSYTMKRSKSETPIEPVSQQAEQKIKNYLNLFGGFHLYNKEGKNITFSLSPKIKEIFLLILVHSLTKNNRKGITSEELSSVIWPDSSPENIKSNRGVAINKIRKILASVEGIELEFADKLWSIKVIKGARCDFLEYYKLKQSLRTEQRAITIQEAEILQGGEFLKDISYEWLEAVRFSINNEIITFLKQFFHSPEFSEEAPSIRLCDIILKFDPVDPDAIKRKIKTLYSAGRHSAAHNTYNLYSAEYQRLYSNNSPFTFNEIISGIND
jgi:two-component SAPR family response regulator